MQKMGFVFSKTKQLTLKKEDARIRKLRQDYLKQRHEYDKLIAENKARIALYRSQDMALDFKEIVYIYLDESYVNRCT